MHPPKLGIGQLPRYGNGWMHQFGHVYALQQELLNKNSNNWFRACELWHTARHEGLALNSSHYTNILKQCSSSGQWEQSLLVLRQMRRDAIRLDVVGLSSVLVSCAKEARWQEALQILKEYKERGMHVDSVCVTAAMEACNKAKQYHQVDALFGLHEQQHLPLFPRTCAGFLEACGEIGHDELALVIVQRATQANLKLGHREMQVIEKLATKNSKLLPFSSRSGAADGKLSLPLN